MALVPVVTNITAGAGATPTASSMINATRNHINSSGTHLTIDAYTADEGLTIGFSAAGEGQQINLRKSGANTIAISIESTGSITDPGDSSPTAPTGTSSDWSGEQQEPNWDVSLGSPSGSSRVWIVELPDALFIWITNSTNAFQVNALHAGRIYIPTNSADAVAAGQDGLAYVAGSPNVGNGSGNQWIGTATACASAHWADGEWSEHIRWQSVPATTDVANLADVAYRPLPTMKIKAVDINGASGNSSVVGDFKYIRPAPAGEGAKTLVVDPSSNQGWMHHQTSGTDGVQVVIWDKTVTP